MRDRKSTQRARLLDGITEVVARDGYAAATIARVIAHAGVSRPTYYTYFANKDDGFLATQRELNSHLLAKIRRAIAKAPPERAPQSAVRALVEFACVEPTRARLLLCEALAAGPQALDQRDTMIGAITNVVEATRAHAEPEVRTPDLPTWSMIAAAHWLLAQRLRQGHDDLEGLAEELVGWVERYDAPSVGHRWRTLDPGPIPPASHFVSGLPDEAPSPLPPGRPRLSRAEVVRNQRERILHATAAVAARKGFNATGITDIAAAAAVESRVFYNHFHDKHEAFLAAHELSFQHTMAVAAGAFFSAADWPERLWRGILAGTQFQATHPALGHLVYVESYAIGAPAITRIDETHAAFTIFLQEGNSGASKPLSQIEMEAIVAASFEVAFFIARRGRGEQMTRFSYHLTYMCLAPFVGPRAANEFIDLKIEAS